MGNRCVGLLNHKFFILYLFYLVMSCLLITLLFSKAIFLDKDFGLVALMNRSLNEAIVYLVASALLVGMGLMTVY